MEENATLDILKQAMVLEQRGRAFYRSVAEKTENKAVQEVFNLLANEEQKHIQVISDQFKAYRKDKRFTPVKLHEQDSKGMASDVLTREIKEKISAAGFEAAAISAGIAMEERAVNLYSESAQNASDPEARALYEWLAGWEREHLNMLLDIDKSLLEKIWFDNKFWPF
jgi:rubrerythrin